MKKLRYELLLLVIVALWGLSFSLTKPLLSKIGVFNFLAYRFIIGGFLISFLTIMTKRFKFSKEVLKRGMISGFLLFIAFYCHIVGLKYTTIAKNSFIVGSSAIYIPLVIYILYKKKSNMMVIVQTAVAILGLASITLVSLDKSLNYGDVLTLIGSIIYAFYVIQVESSVKKYDTNVFTSVQLSTVGILSLVATLSLENITFDFTTSEWMNIAFLSIVLTAVAYYLLNVIQKKLSATNVTLIFTLEPFFATLFGWLFLSEVVGKNVIIGGILILAAVIMPYLNQYILKPYLKKSRECDESVRVNCKVESG